ncbi:MAG: tetratricopeptide repeat protein [Hyphomicrobiaceae bacterium]|nr:MAG: tetratricopeptide repeat protein [Hyphomicrobiaceae bacterium]
MRPKIRLFLWLLSACLMPVGAAADDNDRCRDHSNISAAIAACDRVIASSRSTKVDLVHAYTNRGQAWYTQDQYDQAISDLTTAISLDSRFPIAYGNRGNAWYMKNQLDRAIDDYSEAIRIDPNYTAAYTGRGLAYERRGDNERARESYRGALAVPQKNADGKWAHDKARERLRHLEK